MRYKRCIVIKRTFKQVIYLRYTRLNALLKPYFVMKISCMRIHPNKKNDKMFSEFLLVRICDPPHSCQMARTRFMRMSSVFIYVKNQCSCFQCVNPSNVRKRNCCITFFTS